MSPQHAVDWAMAVIMWTIAVTLIVGAFIILRSMWRDM